MNHSASGHIAFDGTRTPLKTALFLLVCTAWLLPGLVGHDPWKVDEAVAFGVVTEILRSNDWIAFRVAGEPFVDKAPLFYWVSALFAKAFGGLLALHDAARLAAGFFMAATLAFVALACHELLGERAVRLGVLLLIGCLGLLIRAHEMTTDLAGLAGIALALYGLALSARRHLAGGAALGAGMGVAFLGDGFLPLGMLAALLALLPLAGASWRGREYAATVGIALLVALPLLASWPALLYFHAPQSLLAWFDPATALRWRDSGADGWEPFYFVKAVPWYAWPAWPLAAWTVWRARRSLRQRRDVQLCLAAFVAFFVVVSAFGETREVNAMPMLLPLAILGVAEIETLPRGAASALDWFGVTTFFLFAALVWVGWAAALTGKPVFAHAWLQKEVPGFTYPFSFVPFALAALLTLIWLVVVARSLRSSRRAVVNWAAGITMVWMLVMTLGVPLVDQARSYRDVAGRIAAALPKDTVCVARRNVGDAQRASLDYFIGLRTVREEFPQSRRCKSLLVQASPDRLPLPEVEWAEAWRGSRAGDRHELFILYRRR
ncbi:MAG TPA: glycosyltransferase family 39 protein [Usitatibacter sp.]|nr:glycosyltransferase family 39 protein [Usitatibacter sp.]